MLSMAIFVDTAAIDALNTVNGISAVGYFFFIQCSATSIPPSMPNLIVAPRDPNRPSPLRRKGVISRPPMLEPTSAAVAAVRAATLAR